MLWLLKRGLAPLNELASEAAKLSATSWTFVPSLRVCNTLELAPLAKCPGHGGLRTRTVVRAAETICEGCGA